MTARALPPPPTGSWLRQVSAALYVRPRLLTLTLLIPPLLWFGTLYLGSLLALLTQSFYTIDDFTGDIVRIVSLDTYRQLVTQPAHVDIVVRTTIMAIAVTLASIVIAVSRVACSDA